MLSKVAAGPFTGEIPDRDTLLDVLRYIPYNRRTLTTMRCVARPYRSAVQSPRSPWASRREIMVSRYGNCILFNALENAEGQSDFSLCSISPIGRKFLNDSAKLLSRYHVMVANGLSQLTLHHASIGNAFFEPLGTLTNLKALELVSCRYLTSVSNASFIKNLESLTVIFCHLEPDGVSGLRLSRLKKLTLRSCTKLSNLNAVHPDTCAGLEDLHIENCNVFDDTSSAFFSYLGEHIHSINLTSTFVDAALTQIPLAALESLKTLLLSETPLLSSTLDTLTPHLAKALEYLSLGGCCEITDLSALGSLTQLRFLDISQLSSFRNVESVSKCERLELFRCAGTELTSVEFLKKLRQLRVLDAARTLLGDFALLCLEALPQLDTVVLTDCADVSSVNAFHRCPKIRRLLCSHTAITNEGVAMLTECATLEELDLKNTNVTDVNLLADCRSLKIINVCGAITTPDAIQRLLDKPSVEVIYDPASDNEYLDS